MSTRLRVVYVCKQQMKKLPQIQTKKVDFFVAPFLKFTEVELFNSNNFIFVLFFYVQH